MKTVIHEMTNIVYGINRRLEKINKLQGIAIETIQKWNRQEKTHTRNKRTKHQRTMLLLSRFSHVRLCATPQMAAHQAPPSLGFSRQEHWSGLPFPSPMHESEKWKWSRDNLKWLNITGIPEGREQKYLKK